MNRNCTIGLSLFGVFFFFISKNVADPVHIKVFPDQSTKQMMINFSRTPYNESEHKKWSHEIEHIIDKLNDELVRQRYIFPHKKEKTNKKTTWQKIEKFFYNLFYHEYAVKFPKKPNETFMTRRNDDAAGSVSVYIPDGVSPKIFLDILKELMNKQGLCVTIATDPLVHLIATQQPDFEGTSLTLEELEDLKHNRFKQAIQTRLKNLVAKPGSLISTKNLIEKKKLTKQLEFADHIKPYIFWHQSIPCVGLRIQPPFEKAHYPFLPHHFPLWQLASQLGKGVRVAVIDTGIAAFSFKEKSQFLKNKDLEVKENFHRHNYNLVSEDGLDPVEQLTDLIRRFCKPKSINFDNIEQLLISWITDYVKDQKTVGIDNFLIKNGKPGLAKNGALTEEGRRAQAAILKGRYGISPQGRPPNFSLAHMLKPYDQDVLLELLPTAPIEANKNMFVVGHGSHISGIIGARLQSEMKNFQPGDDTGICGIAPRADIFMIKAFDETGNTTKSALISALKKAIKLGADVVNMSLKITDHLDTSEGSSSVLQRMIKLNPYVVAASGNSGDPSRAGYVGQIESYPAKYESVAFDVGSFAFDFDTVTCPVAAYSQSEKDIGPKIIAPGSNILSAGLVPKQKIDSIYLFMSGTSMAAPVISGFIALMLGEYKDVFTKEQLLKTCYCSCVHLHKTKEWYEKSLLGTLDMRTALFVLQVLKQLKISNNFDAYFDRFLSGTLMILFGMADSFSQQYLGGISFKKNCLEYIKKTSEEKGNPFVSFASPDAAVSAVVEVVQQALSALKQKTYQYNGKLIDNKIFERLVLLMKNEKHNSLDDLPKTVRRRMVMHNEVEPYWKNKTDQIRGIYHEDHEKIIKK